MNDPNERKNPIDQAECPHPLERQYAWFCSPWLKDAPKNFWLCVCCCDCGAVLKAPPSPEDYFNEREAQP